MRPRPLHKVTCRYIFLVIVVRLLKFKNGYMGVEESVGLEGVVGEGEHTVAAYAGKSLCAARDLKHGGDGVVRIRVGEIEHARRRMAAYRGKCLHLTVRAAEDFAVGGRQG